VNDILKIVNEFLQNVGMVVNVTQCKIAITAKKSANSSRKVVVVNN
jgi:hypothetical protein